MIAIENVMQKIYVFLIFVWKYTTTFDYIQIVSWFCVNNKVIRVMNSIANINKK